MEPAGHTLRTVNGGYWVAHLTSHSYSVALTYISEKTEACWGWGQKPRLQSDKLQTHKGTQALGP